MPKDGAPRNSGLDGLASSAAPDGSPLQKGVPNARAIEAAAKMAGLNPGTRLTNLQRMAFKLVVHLYRDELEGAPGKPRPASWRISDADLTQRLQLLVKLDHVNPNVRAAAMAQAGNHVLRPVLLVWLAALKQERRGIPSFAQHHELYTDEFRAEVDTLNGAYSWFTP